VEPIRVMLVDDHAVVRQGLRALLEVTDGITVVGEASNGEEAVEQVQALAPDVVLLDLSMPGMGGIEATRQIRRLNEHTRVIVLTSYDDDDKLFQAIEAGAISYLLKNISAGDLISAIQLAKRGETTLQPGIATKLMRQFAARDTLEHLSEREMQVLRLIARGYSNKEISADLKISEKTVKTHVSNILDKLHLEDRTQAAIYALRNRLVSLEGPVGPPNS
jgi:NarL family two-component system response regulator LiaR